MKSVHSPRFPLIALPASLGTQAAQSPGNVQVTADIVYSTYGTRTSYEKMLGFIRNTSTKTGLVVTAYLDRKEYPTGLKPDRQLISSLALKPGQVLPRWNYTIAPNLWS